MSQGFSWLGLRKATDPANSRAMILQLSRGAFTHITADISFGLGLLGCGRVQAQDVLMTIPVAFATVSYSSYLIDLARNTSNNLHMVMNFLRACSLRVHCRHQPPSFFSFPLIFPLPVYLLFLTHFPFLFTLIDPLLTVLGTFLSLNNFFMSVRDF